MKRILIFSLIAPALMSLVTTVSMQHFFSNERAEKLADKLADRSAQSSWSFSYYNTNLDPTPTEMHLGELLLVNIYSGESDGEDWISGGMYTPKAHNKWKKLLAENPKLAYQAIDLFGRQIIRQINEKHQKDIAEVISQITPLIGKEQSNSYRIYSREIKKENGEIEKVYLPQGLQITSTTYFMATGKTRTEETENEIKKYVNIQHKIDSLKSFTPKDFWQKELILFERYVSLVDKLLALDDATLDKYLVSAAMENSYRGLQAYELHEFLVKNKFLETYPHKRTDYFSYDLGHFPLDLILLTYRASREFPAWTPRKFLTEIKSVSNKVKPLMLEQIKKQ